MKDQLDFGFTEEDVKLAHGAGKLAGVTVTLIVVVVTLMLMRYTGHLIFL
jgi:hypothetical protein